MMGFFSSIFRFRKTSVSALLLLSYIGCIIIEAWSRDRALSIPNKEPQLLKQAWLDLERICESPHPYTSHANDDVREYLYGRIQQLCDGADYCTYKSNAASANGPSTPVMFSQKDTFNTSDTTKRIIFFEPANLLVKVKGTDPSLQDDGLLISAHFDSVPAGYGVTDNGMATVAMLAMLTKYVTNPELRPKRTILFNFNDNEEFGLLGSEAFVRDPWFHYVKWFVNLDGAGSGGRALLLRATDYQVAKFYKGAKNPLGTSLLQQGFQDRLIHSQTDFHVYEENGLRGIDICFYEPRALYHTSHDSIQYASKGSLYQIMTSLMGYTDAFEDGSEQQITAQKESGISIDADDQIVSAQPVSHPYAVYFDVLGLWFFSTSTKTLAEFNIALLVAVPVILICLSLIVIRRRTWEFTIRGWFRLPISFLVSFLITFFISRKVLLSPIEFRSALSNGYKIPTLAATCINLLCNYLLLSFFSWIHPIWDQKLICIIELTAFFWTVLIWATEMEQAHDKTGLYLTTLFFAVFSVASILGLISHAFCKKSGKEPSNYTETPPESYSSIEASSNEQQPNTNSDVENASEETPLLNNTPPEPLTSGEAAIISEEPAEEEITPDVHKEYGWILQFLIIVPIITLAVYVTGDLGLDGVHQSGQESIKGDFAAEKFMLSTAVGLGIPALPFIHKLNAPVAAFFGITAIVSSIMTALQKSSSPANPMKIRCVQTVEVSHNPYDNESSSALSLPDSYINLHGRLGFVKPILAELPSIQDGDKYVNCTTDLDDYTETCKYEAKRPWLVDGTEFDNKYQNYVRVEVVSNDKDAGRYEPLNSVLRIHVVDNRMCQLDFNASGYESTDLDSSKRASPVKIITVYNASATGKDGGPGYREPIRVNIPSGHSSDDDGNHYFKVLHGIDMVQVHKLNWTQSEFLVGIQWLPFSLDDDDGEIEQKRHLGVTVTCYYGEFNSEVVVDGVKHRKVSAYDELLAYTPRDTILTNMKPEIVEVKQHIEL